MDVFYNKLEPSEAISGMDVVGGRLDYVDTTHLKWSFLNSNQARLVNPTTGRWELVKCATEPTIANTALDMNGTALAVDKIYDVFAEYSSGTAFTLKCSRWASYGAGTSSRVAAYASGTTYAIRDRVTYDGHDWVKQSSAAAGTTPVAGNDWVDNGTSISGDFAGLYRHNGVLVSDSSTTGKSRRWLGIIYTYNNGGTVNFKDNVNYRFISNYYNAKSKNVVTQNSANTWTYSTGTWREMNSGSATQVRGLFVCCSSGDLTCTLTHTATSSNSLFALGLNTGTADDSHQAPLSSSGPLAVSHIKTRSISKGYNWITQMEYAASSCDNYSYNGLKSSGSVMLFS